MSRGFSKGQSFAAREERESLKKLVDNLAQSANNGFVKATYDTAVALAMRAHAGQFRRDGKTPYFDHVLTVINGVDGWKAKAVAALHDTVEDKRLSYDDLRDAKLPADVIDGIRAMTHPKGMAYLDYIKKLVLPNDLARAVKRADIKANLADAPTDKQIKKYTAALKLLG